MEEEKMCMMRESATESRSRNGNIRSPDARDGAARAIDADDLSIAQLREAGTH
jgi:hypothetical protein